MGIAAMKLLPWLLFWLYLATCFFAGLALTVVAFLLAMEREGERRDKKRGRQLTLDRWLRG